MFFSWNCSIDWQYLRCLDKVKNNNYCTQMAINPILKSKQSPNRTIPTSKYTKMNYECNEYMWWLEYRCHLFFWEDSLASTGSLLVGWTLEEVLVAQMIHTEKIPVLGWIQSGYIHMYICECKYKYILCICNYIPTMYTNQSCIYHMYMKNTWVHVSENSGWTLKWFEPQLRSILLDTAQQDGIWG